MSIAFNVNDNLSLSYTTSDEVYDNQDDAGTAVTTDDDVQKQSTRSKLLTLWVVSIKATTWK